MTDDDEIERDPELRYLDAVLAERFAGSAPRERDEPRAVRHGRWPWLGAALVVVAGLGVVWLATRNDGAGRHAGGQDSRPQTQEVESVRAKDEADFARLLAQARFAVVVATYSTVAQQPLGKGPFAELVVSQRKPIDLLGRIVTRERKLVPAGWEWPHVIRLQLEGRRAVQCAFHLIDGGKRLGVQGLGDYRVEPGEFAEWNEVLLEAEWRTQRLQGFVANGAQLRRSDADAMPVGTKKLRCASLGKSDLGFLRRFLDLEVLDLSPSRSTLSGGDLEALPDLPKLAIVRLDGMRLDMRSTNRLANMPVLAEVEWRGGRCESLPRPEMLGHFLFPESLLLKESVTRVDLSEHVEIDDAVVRGLSFHGSAMAGLPQKARGSVEVVLEGCAGLTEKGFQELQMKLRCGRFVR